MFILRLHCEDKPGIVAAVATSLSNADCNIEESSQFNDRLSGRFFMRVVANPLHETAKAEFLKVFESLAGAFEMQWHINDAKKPVKTLILVSKPDHCLNDLLYRWRTKQLGIDITAIASNHETNRYLAEDRNIPFYHLPVTTETKAIQEAHISALIEQTNSELIVLARYMQILSNDMSRKFAGRVINIHHSFLPGFKGARPYAQAYERGVKIIGATAHFATADLDEGPIIAQDVKHIDHSLDPEALQNLGRDTESQVLSRAIQLFAERRIFMHDKRTIIL